MSTKSNLKAIAQEVSKMSKAADADAKAVKAAAKCVEKAAGNVTGGKRKRAARSAPRKPRKPSSKDQEAAALTHLLGRSFVIPGYNALSRDEVHEMRMAVRRAACNKAINWMRLRNVPPICTTHTLAVKQLAKNGSGKKLFESKQFQKQADELKKKPSIIAAAAKAKKARDAKLKNAPSVQVMRAKMFGSGEKGRAFVQKVRAAAGENSGADSKQVAVLKKRADAFKQQVEDMRASKKQRVAEERKRRVVAVAKVKAEAAERIEKVKDRAAVKVENEKDRLKRIRASLAARRAKKAAAAKKKKSTGRKKKPASRKKSTGRKKKPASRKKSAGRKKKSTGRKKKSSRK